jgi:hypothetical protein
VISCYKSGFNRWVQWYDINCFSVSTIILLYGEEESFVELLFGIWEEG